MDRAEDDCFLMACFSLDLFPFVLLALFFAYVVQYLIPVLYPPDMVHDPT